MIINMTKNEPETDVWLGEECYKKLNKWLEVFPADDDKDIG